MNNKNISLFKQLLFLMGNLKYLFFFVFTLMIVSVIFEMIGLSLIYPMISLLIGDFENNYLNLIEVFLNDFLNFDIDFKNNKNDLLVLVFLLFFIYSFKALSTLILISTNAYLTFKLQANISNKLFTKYLHQDFSQNSKSNTSSKIRNIITETQVFSIDFIVPSLIALTDLLTLIGIASVLFFFLPELSLASLTLIILISSIYLLLTRKTIKKLGYQRQDFEKMRLKFFNEGMNSLKELKISQKENLFFNKFSKYNVQLSYVAIKQSILTSAPQALLEYLAICFLIVLIFYLSINSSENFYLISSLGLFTAAFFKMIPCIYRLVSCFSRIRYAMPVNNLLYNELIKFRKPAISYKPINNFGSENDRVSLKNIKFRFNENSSYIFNKLNITFNLGGFIGIKGKSGSGKSTFIDILLGLNKPQSGEIIFNNKKVNNNIKKFYRSIYYLPQSIYLMEDTILKNITFQETDDYDNKLLIRSLEISGLTSFVKSLSNGINTQIGENGAKLSGGQKQRIGLARAIYSDSNILIMDESTNALDYESEKKIISALKKFKLFETVFFITHREKMLEFCNLVLSVKNQKISKIKK